MMLARQPPGRRNHPRISSGSRAMTAERETAYGREANSTPTSSARSDGTLVIFNKPIETAADPALAFRHRAVGARPAKARSTRGRMADPGARTMITVQHRPRADHR